MKAALARFYPLYLLADEAGGLLHSSREVDFKTELRWEKSDYDGSKILQVPAGRHVLLESFLL